VYFLIFFVKVSGKLNDICVFDNLMAESFNKGDLIGRITNKATFKHLAHFKASPSEYIHAKVSRRT